MANEKTVQTTTKKEAPLQAFQIITTDLRVHLVYAHSYYEACCKLREELYNND